MLFNHRWATVTGADHIVPPLWWFEKCCLCGNIVLLVFGSTRAVRWKCRVEQAASGIPCVYWDTATWQTILQCEEFLLWSSAIITNTCNYTNKISCVVVASATKIRVLKGKSVVFVRPTFLCLAKHPVTTPCSYIVIYSIYKTTPSNSHPYPHVYPIGPYSLQSNAGK